MIEHSPIHGVYAITPDEHDTERLLALVTQAVSGGVRLLQYRNKTATAALRAHQAQVLARLCKARGVELIINDDAPLAAQVAAAGVHVGRDDGGVDAARASVGAAIVGVSCYNDVARGELAARQGADYVAFGSVFTSSTKPAAVRASLDLLRQARARLALPVVAIGGITLDNAREVIAAGAHSIAVSNAIFGVAEVEQAAARFCQLFEVS